MEFIYGKLNKEIEVAEYKGLSTQTAKVSIDNTNYTIAVDILGNTGESVDAVKYTKQYLSDSQINQVYSNLKLLDYLNKNIILTNSESQNVTGDLWINGNLSTSNNYITIDNKTALDGPAGLKVKNWSENRDAAIYVNREGKLYFTNDIVNQEILTKGDDLVYNQFIYYNGQSVSTRKIKPLDIDTSGYTPTKYSDLVTKDYIDIVYRDAGNYKAVERFEDITNESVWTGLRVFATEEAIINE